MAVKGSQREKRVTNQSSVLQVLLIRDESHFCLASLNYVFKIQPTQNPWV